MSKGFSNYSTKAYFPPEHYVQQSEYVLPLSLFSLEFWECELLYPNGEKNTADDKM